MYKWLDQSTVSWYVGVMEEKCVGNGGVVA